MLLILMIVGLIYAYSEISARYKEFNREIGEKQFELINTYQKGEKALLYIDRSAKYSSYQGIYDLAKSGGCSFGKEYNMYRLWTVNIPIQGVCFPSIQDSKNGFFDFFKSILNKYLQSYNVLNLPLPQNNYELSFNGAALVGIAKTPLAIPIIEGISSKNLGTYSIKAPFKVNIENYDFSDYDKLKSKAQDVINKCGNANQANPKRVPVNCVNEPETKNIFNYENLALSACIDGKKPVEFLEYKWELDVRSSIYGFCVKSSNPKVYAYEEADSTIGLKDIMYRFGLSFEDLNCALQGHPELVNTKCMEFPCDAYYSCQDAAPLCYCSPGTGNACQGQCLPFCSAANQNFVVDVDASTSCKKYSCSSYWSCGDLTDNSCGCPDPSSPNDDNACTGLDCSKLHCERDAEFEGENGIKTNCRSEACNYYDKSGGHSCSSTNLCQCSGINACQGDCTCEEKHNNRGCRVGGVCGNSDVWEVTFPHGCQKNQYTYCGACNQNCDPCRCLLPTTGCGVCGREECPPPPEPPSCYCTNACGIDCLTQCGCDPSSNTPIGCKNNCP